MKEVLVDTSVIIDFLRIKDKKSSYFYHLSRSNYQLYLSIISHAEFYAGKSVWQHTQAQKELQIILSNMIIVPLDEVVSQIAGHIRAGSHIDLYDAIIAATAIRHKMPLATMNLKHFIKVKNLELIE